MLERWKTIRAWCWYRVKIISIMHWWLYLSSNRCAANTYTRTFVSLKHVFVKLLICTRACVHTKHTCVNACVHTYPTYVYACIRECIHNLHVSACMIACACTWVHGQCSHARAYITCVCVCTRVYVITSTPFHRVYYTYTGVHSFTETKHAHI